MDSATATLKHVLEHQVRQMGELSNKDLTTCTVGLLTGVLFAHNPSDVHPLTRLPYTLSWLSAIRGGAYAPKHLSELRQLLLDNYRHLDVVDWQEEALEEMIVRTMAETHLTGIRNGAKFSRTTIGKPDALLHLPLAFLGWSNLQPYRDMMLRLLDALNVHLDEQLLELAYLEYAAQEFACYDLGEVDGGVQMIKNVVYASEEHNGLTNAEHNAICRNRRLCKFLASEVRENGFGDFDKIKRYALAFKTAVSPDSQSSRQGFQKQLRNL